MNFKQLKPETRAALRAASAKIRSMQSAGAQTSTLVTAAQPKRTIVRPNLRVGRLGRAR